MGREYKLYESILKSKVLDKTKANIFIDTLIENCTKFNRGSLKKAKYNLISEIKNHYNLDEFFGSKIINYKALASVYTLIESYNSIEFSNIDQIITLDEFLKKNRVGDHIWYISNNKKFMKKYPKWKQKFNIRRIILDLIYN